MLYIYTYVRTFTNIYRCIHAFKFISLQMQTHTHAHSHTRMHSTHTRTYRILDGSAQTHIRTCVCVHARVSAYTYVCLHTHTCVCIHTRVSAYTHVCLHTHTCVCIHSRVSACTQMCLLMATESMIACVIPKKYPKIFHPKPLNLNPGVSVTATATMGAFVDPMPQGITQLPDAYVNCPMPAFQVITCIHIYIYIYM